MADDAPLRGCTSCGLVQRLPMKSGRFRCARCGHRLHGGERDRRRLTAVLALTGLVIYPAAIVLPVMTISRMGRSHSAGVLDGAVTLLQKGDLLVGLAVLIASVILPFMKLLLLLVLDLVPQWLRAHQRGLAWWVVETTGRWGMLDVLLVAVLASIIKLGDLVHVEAGPGAALFTLLVTLSLLASASFDPHAIWEEDSDHD